MSDKKNRGRIKQGSAAVTAVFYALAVLLALITLYPVIFVISSSISKPAETAAGRVWLLPRGFSTQAYVFVLHSRSLLRSFLNSVLYTAVITLGSLTVTMMCGFGLSRRGLLWKKAIQVYIVLPMWFGAGLIPAFINMTRLGLVNTLGAVLLPMMISSYNVILARTFISKLPDGLMEAAMIDGAGAPTLFARIVLPLSKPIMAVLALYAALYAWNEWFGYMVYLPSKKDLHPLQYYLVKTLLIGQTQAQLNVDDTIQQAMEKIQMQQIIPQLKYAVIVVTTFPIMCLYPFVQKYFVQGVMLGSLKE